MSKKTLSFVSVFLLFVLSSISLSAQNIQGSDSASVANRRTAVRYLQLAKQFAAEKLWSEADSNAKMGLAYDDKIADLWYIRAVSQMNLGEKRSKVLPLVVTALTEAEWVDYNRDGARILYADILCSSRLFTQALSVLDSDPFIYSADAEYIRAKSYYSIGDQESLAKARDRLDAARRVYPADSRFAQLFYSNEYLILRKTGNLSEEAERLSNAFALTVPLYKNAGGELEVYAAIFAKDPAKKVRMLRAFNSKQQKSPLYAIEALKAGLLDEDSALDYFYQFSDKVISLDLIETFASLLKADEAKKEFSEYLNSYNGSLTIDVDGDLISNMTVAYKRGRPETISYDENQDDDCEWKATCDFGVPLKLDLTENALELEYSSWPYISSATYKIDNKHSDLRLVLITETLAWTPFAVEADKAILESLGSDFFIPVLKTDDSSSVSWQDLIRSSLSYTIPSSEREGAVIQASLLNGVPQMASYSVGDKIYAMAKFEKGLPVYRKLDVDGDGLFETVEYYGFSKNHDENFISINDELQIMTNLFGSPAQGTGFYVKKITVDRNGDTIPDFTEEYIPGTVGDKKPGKIASWDTNGDGEWDVQYIKHPSMLDGKLREEAKFHQPLTKSVVTVVSENGLPVFVQKGNEILSVSKGKARNFYWISEAGTDSNEENITNEINQVSEQGVSMIVESGEKASKKRFLAVRIEKMIFAMEIKN
ncbi:MAG: hypothetical protein IKO39_08700 [Treponema sp.]|nr:hypothetical protein [Treponema sp.]